MQEIAGQARNDGDWFRYAGASGRGETKKMPLGIIAR